MNKRQVYNLFFSDLRKAGIKMAEFIKAFLSVAIAGSFLGFIVPENKMSKPINFLISLVAVSYTHLDVYKRQASKYRSYIAIPSAFLLS